MSYRLSAGVSNEQAEQVWGYTQNNPGTSLRKRTLIIERETAEDMEMELIYLGAAIGSSVMTSFRWINISQG